MNWTGLPELCLGMGYVMFLDLHLMHRFMWTCNMLHDFQLEKKNEGKICPARSEVIDNLWVLLIKKESTLDFQHKIRGTYMSKNFTIVKWENEDVNYALLLMHYNLEFILY